MFSAPLLVGIWRTEGTEHYVLSLKTGQETRVHEVMAPLVGQMCQIAFHHIPSPPTPMNPKGWINIQAGGKLSFNNDTGIYSVLSLDETQTDLDFSLVNGHCARFLGVTTHATEQKNQDTAKTADLDKMVKGLMGQARDLQSLLKTLMPEGK